MNNKKIDVLYDQLSSAVQIIIASHGNVDFQYVNEICGKPDNIIICLSLAVDVDNIEEFLFTEKNLNDAVISQKHNLVMCDTENQTHTINVYAARLWNIHTKW